MSIPFTTIGPGHGKLSGADGREFHFITREEYYLIQEFQHDKLVREKKFDDGDDAYFEVSVWIDELRQSKK